jgi:hypothetical protein
LALWYGFSRISELRARKKMPAGFRQETWLCGMDFHAPALYGRKKKIRPVSGGKLGSVVWILVHQPITAQRN